MAPNFCWLNACKGSQLKALATAVGINSSGTKLILISRLQANLPNSLIDGNNAGSEVISIDMGIRNLAYCRIDLSKSRPVILEWDRFAISKSQKHTNLETTSVKEAFDPATYSQYAYHLIKFLLSDPSKPTGSIRSTHVLIERQRFRSMGGSAVQEWTLRVNMFEAMIYAVLKTFSELGGWKGTVHTVTPAKVSNFWLSESQAGGTGIKGSKAARTKTAKIGLVEEWLRETLKPKGPRRLAGYSSSRFELHGQAAKMVEAFVDKRRGSKTIPANNDMNRSSSRSEKVQVGKLDDLADCLLQGMAWVQWEKNRELIVAKGIEALDETRS